MEAEARHVDASRLDHLQDDRSALNLDCVAVHNHLYVVGTFLLGTMVSPLCSCGSAVLLAGWGDHILILR